MYLNFRNTLIPDKNVNDSTFKSKNFKNKTVKNIKIKVYSPFHRIVSFALTLQYLLLLNVIQLNANPPSPASPPPSMPPVQRPAPVMPPIQKPSASNIQLDKNSLGRASVINASNGASVVNIAKTNSAGVSRTTFSNFNVGTKGAVINNSIVGGKSEVAGKIGANNYLGGKAAKVIVNEVTGTNTSNLHGKTEVYGKKAEYILANPFGVNCDGCSYSNASKVTLTTGKVNLDSKGAVKNIVNDNNANQQAAAITEDGLKQAQELFENQGVKGSNNKGKITISGDGMDTSRVDSVNLISNKVKIDGTLTGNNVGIMLGNNKVNYKTNKVNALKDQATEKNSDYSLNVTDQGKIEASNLNINSTQKNSVINLGGNISATSGDININSKGDVLVGSKVTSAYGNVSIKSDNGILNGVSAKLDQDNDNEIIFDNAGNLEKNNNVLGIISAGQNVSLGAGSRILNNGGTISAGYNVELNSGNTKEALDKGIENLAGGVIGAGYNVILKTSNGGNITNNSKIEAGSWLELNSSGDIINNSKITSNSGYTNIEAVGNIVNSKGATIDGGSGVSISSGKNTKLLGDVYGGQSLIIKSGGLIVGDDENDVNLKSLGDISLSTEDKTMALSLKRGTIGAGGNLYVSAAANADVEREFSLKSGNSIWIDTAGSFSNKGRMLANKAIDVRAKKDIANDGNVLVGDVDKLSILLDRANASNTLMPVSNAGIEQTLASRNDSFSNSLYTADQVNDKFSVKSNLASNSKYKNSINGYISFTSEEGDVSFGSNSAMAASDIYLEAVNGNLTNNGLVNAQNTLNIKAGSNLENKNNGVLVGGNVYLKSGNSNSKDSVLSNAGIIQASNFLTLSSSNKFENTGSIRSDYLNISANTLSNKSLGYEGSGLIHANTQLLIGKVDPKDKETIELTSFKNNGGTISTDGYAQINVNGNLDNINGNIKAENLYLTVANKLTNSGNSIISGREALSLTLGEYDTEKNEISKSGSLDNSGSLLSENGSIGVTVYGGNLVNNGNILSKTYTQLQAKGGNIVNDANGKIKSEGYLSIIAGAYKSDKDGNKLDKDGNKLNENGNDVVLHAGKIENKGDITGDGVSLVSVGITNITDEFGISSSGSINSTSSLYGITLQSDNGIDLSGSNIYSKATTQLSINSKKAIKAENAIIETGLLAVNAVDGINLNNASVEAKATASQMRDLLGYEGAAISLITKKGNINATGIGSKLIGDGLSIYTGTGNVDLTSAKLGSKNSRFINISLSACDSKSPKYDECVKNGNNNGGKITLDDAIANSDDIFLTTDKENQAISVNGANLAANNSLQLTSSKGNVSAIGAILGIKSTDTIEISAGKPLNGVAVNLSNSSMFGRQLSVNSEAGSIWMKNASANIGLGGINVRAALGKDSIGSIDASADDPTKTLLKTTGSINLTASHGDLTLVNSNLEAGRGGYIDLTAGNGINARLAKIKGGMISLDAGRGNFDENEKLKSNANYADIIISGAQIQATANRKEIMRITGYKDGNGLVNGKDEYGNDYVSSAISIVSRYGNVVGDKIVNNKGTLTGDGVSISAEYGKITANNFNIGSSNGRKVSIDASNSISLDDSSLLGKQITLNSKRAYISADNSIIGDSKTSYISLFAGGNEQKEYAVGSAGRAYGGGIGISLKGSALTSSELKLTSVGGDLLMSDSNLNVGKGGAQINVVSGGTYVAKLTTKEKQNIVTRTNTELDKLISTIGSEALSKLKANFETNLKADSNTALEKLQTELSSYSQKFPKLVEQVSINVNNLVRSTFAAKLTTEEKSKILNNTNSELDNLYSTIGSEALSKLKANFEANLNKDPNTALDKLQTELSSYTQNDPNLVKQISTNINNQGKGGGLDANNLVIKSNGNVIINVSGNNELGFSGNKSSITVSDSSLLSLTTGGKDVDLIGANYSAGVISITGKNNIKLGDNANLNATANAKQIASIYNKLYDTSDFNKNNVSEGLNITSTLGSVTVNNAKLIGDGVVLKADNDNNNATIQLNNSQIGGSNSRYVNISSSGDFDISGNNRNLNILASKISLFSSKGLINASNSNLSYEYTTYLSIIAKNEVNLSNSIVKADGAFVQSKTSSTNLSSANWEIGNNNLTIFSGNYFTDESGNNVFKKDSNGNFLKDENGNKISAAKNDNGEYALSKDDKAKGYTLEKDFGYGGTVYLDGINLSSNSNVDIKGAKVEANRSSINSSIDSMLSISSGGILNIDKSNLESGMINISAVGDIFKAGTKIHATANREQIAQFYGFDLISNNNGYDENGNDLLGGFYGAKIVSLEGNITSSKTLNNQIIEGGSISGDNVFVQASNGVVELNNNILGGVYSRGVSIGSKGNIELIGAKIEGVNFSAATSKDQNGSINITDTTTLVKGNVYIKADKDITLNKRAMTGANITLEASNGQIFNNVQTAAIGSNITGNIPITIGDNNTDNITIISKLKLDLSNYNLNAINKVLLKSNADNIKLDNSSIYSLGEIVINAYKDIELNKLTMKGADINLEASYGQIVNNGQTTTIGDNNTDKLSITSRLKLDLSNYNLKAIEKVQVTSTADDIIFNNSNIDSFGEVVIKANKNIQLGKLTMKGADINLEATYGQIVNNVQTTTTGDKQTTTIGDDNTDRLSITSRSTLDLSNFKLNAIEKVVLKSTAGDVIFNNSEVNSFGEIVIKAYKNIELTKLKMTGADINLEATNGQIVNIGQITTIGDNNTDNLSITSKLKLDLSNFNITALKSVKLTSTADDIILNNSKINSFEKVEINAYNNLDITSANIMGNFINLNSKNGKILGSNAIIGDKTTSMLSIIANNEVNLSNSVVKAEGAYVQSKTSSTSVSGNWKIGNNNLTILSGYNFTDVSGNDVFKKDSKGNFLKDENGNKISGLKNNNGGYALSKADIANGYTLEKDFVYGGTVNLDGIILTSKSSVDIKGGKVEANNSKIKSSIDSMLSINSANTLNIDKSNFESGMINISAIDNISKAGTNINALANRVQIAQIYGYDLNSNNNGYDENGNDLLGGFYGAKIVSLNGNIKSTSTSKNIEGGSITGDNVLIQALNGKVELNKNTLGGVYSRGVSINSKDDIDIIEANIMGVNINLNSNNGKISGSNAIIGDKTTSYLNIIAKNEVNLSNSEVKAGGAYVQSKTKSVTISTTEANKQWEIGKNSLTILAGDYSINASGKYVFKKGPNGKFIIEKGEYIPVDIVDGEYKLTAEETLKGYSYDRVFLAADNQSVNLDGMNLTSKSDVDIKGGEVKAINSKINSLKYVGIYANNLVDITSANILGSNINITSNKGKISGSYTILGDATTSMLSIIANDEVNLSTSVVKAGGAYVQSKTKSVILSSAVNKQWEIGKKNLTILSGIYYTDKSNNSLFKKGSDGKFLKDDKGDYIPVNIVDGEYALSQEEKDKGYSYDRVFVGAKNENVKIDGMNLTSKSDVDIKGGKVSLINVNLRDLGANGALTQFNVDSDSTLDMGGTISFGKVTTHAVNDINIVKDKNIPANSKIEATATFVQLYKAAGYTSENDLYTKIAQQNKIDYSKMTPDQKADWQSQVKKMFKTLNITSDEGNITAVDKVTLLGFGTNITSTKGTIKFGDNSILGSTGGSAEFFNMFAGNKSVTSSNDAIIARNSNIGAADISIKSGKGNIDLSCVKDGIVCKDGKSTNIVSSHSRLIEAGGKYLGLNSTVTTPILTSVKGALDNLTTIFNNIKAKPEIIGLTITETNVEVTPKIISLTKTDGTTPLFEGSTNLSELTLRLIGREIELKPESIRSDDEKLVLNYYQTLYDSNGNANANANATTTTTNDLKITVTELNKQTQKKISLTKADGTTALFNGSIGMSEDYLKYKVAEIKLKSPLELTNEDNLLLQYDDKSSLQSRKNAEKVVDYITKVDPKHEEDGIKVKIEEIITKGVKGENDIAILSNYLETLKYYSSNLELINDNNYLNTKQYLTTFSDEIEKLKIAQRKNYEGGNVNIEGANFTGGANTNIIAHRNASEFTPNPINENQPIDNSTINSGIIYMDSVTVDNTKKDLSAVSLRLDASKITGKFEKLKGRLDLGITLDGSIKVSDILSYKSNTDSSDENFTLSSVALSSHFGNITFDSQNLKLNKNGKVVDVLDKIENVYLKAASGDIKIESDLKVKGDILLDAKHIKDANGSILTDGTSAPKIEYGRNLSLSVEDNLTVSNLVKNFEGVNTTGKKYDLYAAGNLILNSKEGSFLNDGYSVKAEGVLSVTAKGDITNNSVVKKFNINGQESFSINKAKIEGSSVNLISQTGNIINSTSKGIFTSKLDSNGNLIMPKIVDRDGSPITDDTNNTLEIALNNLMANNGTVNINAIKNYHKDGGTEENQEFVGPAAIIKATGTTTGNSSGLKITAIQGKVDNLSSEITVDGGTSYITALIGLTNETMTYKAALINNAISFEQAVARSSQVIGDNYNAELQFKNSGNIVGFGGNAGPQAKIEITNGSLNILLGSNSNKNANLENISGIIKANEGTLDLNVSGNILNLTLLLSNKGQFSNSQTTNVTYSGTNFGQQAEISGGNVNLKVSDNYTGINSKLNAINNLNVDVAGLISLESKAKEIIYTLNESGNGAGENYGSVYNFETSIEQDSNAYITTLKSGKNMNIKSQRLVGQGAEIKTGGSLYADLKEGMKLESLALTEIKKTSASATASWVEKDDILGITYNTRNYTLKADINKSITNFTNTYDITKKAYGLSVGGDLTLKTSNADIDLKGVNMNVTGNALINAKSLNLYQESDSETTSGSKNRSKSENYWNNSNDPTTLGDNKPKIVSRVGNIKIRKDLKLNLTGDLNLNESTLDVGGKLNSTVGGNLNSTGGKIRIGQKSENYNLTTDTTTEQFDSLSKITVKGETTFTAVSIDGMYNNGKPLINEEETNVNDTSYDTTTNYNNVFKYEEGEANGGLFSSDKLIFKTSKLNLNSGAEFSIVDIRNKSGNILNTDANITLQDIQDNVLTSDKISFSSAKNTGRVESNDKTVSRIISEIQSGSENQTAKLILNRSDFTKPENVRKKIDKTTLNSGTKQTEAQKAKQAVNEAAAAEARAAAAEAAESAESARDRNRGGGRSSNW